MLVLSGADTAKENMQDPTPELEKAHKDLATANGQIAGALSRRMFSPSLLAAWIAKIKEALATLEGLK